MQRSETGRLIPGEQYWRSSLPLSKKLYKLNFLFFKIFNKNFDDLQFWFGPLTKLNLPLSPKQLKTYPAKTFLLSSLPNLLKYAIEPIVSGNKTNL